MDRILLGKGESEPGFWVSKPTINVIAYASNGFYSATEAGPEGLRDDGSVLPIYGYNENFEWTGSNTYTYGFVNRDPGAVGSLTKMYTTEDGTLRLIGNTTLSSSGGDPWFISVLNTAPNWTSGSFYDGYHRNDLPDQSFSGNNYPLLEFRIRKPPKADGTHWKQADYENDNASFWQIFYHTSNATHLDTPSGGLSGTHSFRTNNFWYEIMGEEGDWVTIEYDFENRDYRFERGGVSYNRSETQSLTSGSTLGAPSIGSINDWASDTFIDAIRIDPMSGNQKLPAGPEADWEIDYIRSKKRGIPLGFGNSVEDNFSFNSDWFRTGLIHQTGTVVIGNEYAYANGAAKPSGTSHKGSTSGRVEFPKLPYVPVVLFQRYDDADPDKKFSFPGGDKEFSFVHGEMSSNNLVWNPLTKEYQPKANSAHASEYRTFAYARSGYEHFDLTCRNAIARDGYEWLFNYTPQEPYVELYKGGNYDPESENPESFVMYPQTTQTHSGAWGGGGASYAFGGLKDPVVKSMGVTFPSAYTKDGTTATNTITPGGEPVYIMDDAIMTPWATAPAFDNGLYAVASEIIYQEKSPRSLSGSLTHRGENQSVQSINGVDAADFGISYNLTSITRREFRVMPLPNEGVYHAAVGSHRAKWSFGLAQTAESKQTTKDNDEWLAFAQGQSKSYPWEAQQDILRTFSDDSSSGGAFAVGRMKDGTLGVRRGQVITNSTIPTEGWDQTTGAGIPEAGPTITDATFASGGDIGAAAFTSLADSLDYSARDYSEGKLGHFANFTGTDAGNCLPTFDFANKFGDWNVPQFNNFYQYDADVGAGSYTSFKDAIGTSWTEHNTKFLDDSMWMGYANNRFEYKGDLWHPQAPTKTYDELSGVYGLGASIKNQGDWAHFAGLGTADERNVHYESEAVWGGNIREPDAFYQYPQHGVTGVHAVSRYDRAPTAYTVASPYSDSGGHVYNEYDSYEVNKHLSNHGPFNSLLTFKNRYAYRPGNKTSSGYWNDDVQNHLDRDMLDQFSPDYAHLDAGGSGPGSHFTYDAPHDYARMGAFAPSFNANWNVLDLKQFTPPTIFWPNRAKTFSPWTLWMGQGQPSGERDRKYNFPDTGISQSSEIDSNPDDFFDFDPDTEKGRFAFGLGHGTIYPFGPTAEGYSTPWNDWFGNLNYEDRAKNRSSWHLGFRNALGAFAGIEDEYRISFGASSLPNYYTFRTAGIRYNLGEYIPIANPENIFDGGSIDRNYVDDLVYPFNSDEAPRHYDDASWTEPQTGYYGHKDSFVANRWYTYPGATFAYDISNFSGPAHYNAWHKNDRTDEVQDYKRRDYPQLYAGGWGNYGYFPTQEQLDAGRGATRLFPNPTTDMDDVEDQDLRNLEFSSRDIGGIYLTAGESPTSQKPYENFQIYSPYGYGSWVSKSAGESSGTGDGQVRIQTTISDQPGTHKQVLGLHDSLFWGPNVIFSKSATLGNYYDESLNFPNPKFFKNYTPLNQQETNLVNDNGGSKSVQAFFRPNHLHANKKVSRTFGIPNDIAGDYYVASKRHNERGVHPDVTPTVSLGQGYNHDDVGANQGHIDPLHYTVGGTGGTQRNWIGSGIHGIHTKNTGLSSVANLGSPFGDGQIVDVLDNITIISLPYNGVVGGGGNSGEFQGYYHPITNPTAELTEEHGGPAGSEGEYPDVKLKEYLYNHGIDITKLQPGEPIPIQADPHFAGMSFEGTNAITGAFNAHRFEFIIKKTKKHINHFRQSYEYNLPGKSPHRADTLRPIGYGLVTNHYGFDGHHTPPPAAHSYFDGRQLSGGLADHVNQKNRWTVDFDNVLFSYEHNDGTITDSSHPGYADFGGPTLETKYDSEMYADYGSSKFYSGNYRTFSTDAINEGTSYYLFTGSSIEFVGTSVSISRHGRDSVVEGIIGAVELANSYSADNRATFYDAGSSSYKNWMSDAGGLGITNTPQKGYYALADKTLKYRPAKSQGASPETQMYGAYLGAPFNRWSDITTFNAGIGSDYHSTGNWWEEDILPGMCKADNALTNWGTVDLSKFDHESYGYRWHNDAWYENDKSGLADSIKWQPSKNKLTWAGGTGGVKGYGIDPFGYKEGPDDANKKEANYRLTEGQKGGTYDGFKLHERPEFQPVSGDGRYFGGVGGVDNWGGTSYNTWGPGMSVSPTIWDLKWGSIQHPYGIAPTPEQDANTFYGDTSIQNQTSYIGGAPNVRVLIGDNGGTFKYSDGREVSGTGYDASNTWSATPQNYDWAIGGHQIQCNHWDRTLKIKDLDFWAGKNNDGSERRGAHANNGLQSVLSLKVKACYLAGVDRQQWVVENNGVIKNSTDLGWNIDDELLISNAKEAGLDLSDTPVTIKETPAVYTSETNFAPIQLSTSRVKLSNGSDAGILETADSGTPSGIQNSPQLVIYNKTLAELPLSNARRSTKEFKANTTYHFQYMYDEEKINPPKYKYWVLRIPAGLDAYNGESLL